MILCRYDSGMDVIEAGRLGGLKAGKSERKTAAARRNLELARLKKAQNRSCLPGVHPIRKGTDEDISSK